MLPTPPDLASNPGPTVEVVIISWQGMRESSLRIAAQLDGLPGVRLRTLYSNVAEAPETGPGQWQQVPNDHYFGKKFAAALAGFDSDVLLIVQADALSTDWRLVATRCQARFAQRPRLGLWTPRIDYTPWTPERVDIRPLDGQGLTAVSQTDGIVLAFSASAIERLRRLDYSRNNFGWGIDWVAVCHCYVNDLEVLREDALAIAHSPSSGYAREEAGEQGRIFMQQMSDREQTMFKILKRFAAERHDNLYGTLLRRLAKRRAKQNYRRCQVAMGLGASAKPAA